MLSTTSGKVVNRITHHVSFRQMIYTKKQIGWKHEIRQRKLIVYYESRKRELLCMSVGVMKD
jgi:hypothetical protein